MHYDSRILVNCSLQERPPSYKGGHLFIAEGVALFEGDLLLFT